jgi:ubiquinone/menaquinone biosynthesis C-methylase UbiE
VDSADKKETVNKRNHHVCPVEIAGILDIRLRRWIQNPKKILGPYIRDGMTVLDLGCGPGFFTIEMAQMVGKSGQVIAADFQEGMLQKVRRKISGMQLEERITLHQCGEDRIGVTTPVDFVLLFYVVHELSDQLSYLIEIEKILKPSGKVLLVEPPFHVSRKTFEDIIRKANCVGLIVVDRPRSFLNKAVLMMKIP